MVAHEAKSVAPMFIAPTCVPFTKIAIPSSKTERKRAAVTSPEMFTVCRKYTVGTFGSASRSSVASSPSPYPSSALPVIQPPPDSVRHASPWSTPWSW
jgi:hypothetical protein